MKQNKLNLEVGHWYGWQMLPGYSKYCESYFSPIYIEAINPLKSGQNQITLTFANVMYAEGVKGFEKTLKILSHKQQYLLAELKDDQERCAVISEISFEWIKQHLPELWYHKPPSHFEGLASSECDYYLNTLFLGTLRP
jgi:hypothetical protein